MANKYGNIKTITSDGIKHDSKKEANRWCVLKLLERAGKIQDLQRQVKYELIPKQDGERPVYYIADFVYMENGNKVVEDAKGMRTKEYKLKNLGTPPLIPIKAEPQVQSLFLSLSFSVIHWVWLVKCLQGPHRKYSSLVS